MARGKSIQLYLMDGHPQGIVKTSLANWNGLAYRIPRIELEHAKTVPQLQQTGIYLLFGTDDQNEQPLVYVGQAVLRQNGTGILNRLNEHRRNPDKAYWTEAVAITTATDSLGPTELNYLEHTLNKLAQDSGRYEVQNGNNPNPGQVTEEKADELADFIDNVRLLVGALGYSVFESLLDTPEDDEIAPATLFLEQNTHTGHHIVAQAQQTADGFVVLAGSDVYPHTADYLKSARSRERRDQAKLDAAGKTLQNYAFNSPSSAAEFIMGRPMNGPKEWKNANGISLKDLED